MIIAFFSHSLSLFLSVLYPSIIISFSSSSNFPRISPSHSFLSFLFPSFPHFNNIANRELTTRWKITKNRWPTVGITVGISNRFDGAGKKRKISRDLTVVDEGSKEQVRMTKPRIPRNHATNGYEKRQQAHAYRELLFGNVRVRVPSTSRRVDRVPRWYHLVEGKVEHRDRPPRTKWRFSRGFNSAYHGPPTSFLRCFDRPLIVPNHLSLSLSLSLSFLS